MIDELLLARRRGGGSELSAMSAGVRGDPRQTDGCWSHADPVQRTRSLARDRPPNGAERANRFAREPFSPLLARRVLLHSIGDNQEDDLGSERGSVCAR